jgi:hypothetical protein
MEYAMDFSSIVPGASVRAVKIDGEYYVPRRDVILVVCSAEYKESPNGYHNAIVNASKIWTQRISHTEREALLPYMKMYQFKGPGYSTSEVLTIEGAMMLLMVLPGKFAKSLRLKACKVLTRFLRGDLSLIKEIVDNHERGIEASCMEFVSEAFADHRSEERTEMPPVEYLYGTVSSAFPGLVKIGRSQVRSACAKAT